MSGIQKGPCKRCGAVNYGLSTSGPDYCGACACGVNPKVSQLRRDLEKSQDEKIDYMLALAVALKHKTSAFTPKMIERGEACIARFTDTTPRSRT